MILGQSAATAAVMAIDGGIAVQEVSYDKLRERLLADGQVLEHKSSAKKATNPKKLEGIVIDDSDATRTGTWVHSTASDTMIGSGYHHDESAGDGKATAIFETKLPKSGKYEVRFGYTPNTNRAENVTVAIQHADGVDTKLVDETKAPPIDGAFVSLGEFEFSVNEPAKVTVTNENTKGYVVIDAVQWIAK